MIDAQTIELAGRSQLTSELLRAGLEVPMPLRDRGIDLIAYVDTGDNEKPMLQARSSANISVRWSVSVSWSWLDPVQGT